jgi:beta-lactamase regulating signal transducer with metallopeptidase domain
MTNALPFQEFAQLFSVRMLNGIAAGLVVAAFAWLFLRLSSRQNSGTRFAIWFSSLVAIVVLPFVDRLSLSSAGVASPSSQTSALALPARWALPIVLVWAAIAGINLLRTIVGLVRLRKLRASATPVDLERLDPRLQKTLMDFRGRKVTLCVSAQQKVPAAIGFIRPIVLLPEWALNELSTEELNSILIHELAHLQRWDDWTNLAQKILRALFFFHPAVWWIESQLSIEREMACDEVVLAHTENARSYAECLVNVAEKSFVRRSLALTQAAVSRVQETSKRISRILGMTRPNAIGIRKPALGLVAAFALICGVSQSRMPELIAFRESAPAQASLARASQRPRLQTVAFEQEPGVAVVSKKPVHAGAHAARKAVVQTATEGAAIEAKLDDTSTSMIKRVAAQQEKTLASQTMLVVFQSQQYRAGQMQWTVFVWQVSVQKSAQAPLPARRT